MKLLVMSAVGLLSSAAMAFPSQGDDAKFNLTETLGAQSASGVYEETITQLDTTANSYQQTTTVTVTGQAPQVSTSAGQVSDLMSSDAVANVLSNCTAFGGTITQLTVAAGTFQTCAVPVNNDDQTGTFWLGNVPFGIVQADFTLTSNGAHIQLGLASYAPSAQ